MNDQILDLSMEEIACVAGSAKIDPPAQTSTVTTEGLNIYSQQGADFPQIENDPPG